MEVDGDEEPGPQRCKCSWLHLRIALVLLCHGSYLGSFQSCCGIGLIKIVAIVNIFIYSDCVILSKFELVI
jgi:hypothetical protein